MQPQTLIDTEHAAHASEHHDKWGNSNRPPLARARSTTTDAPPVTAALGYLHPMAERPFNYMYEPPNGGPWQNCEYRQQAVAIRDARSRASQLSVDREGFELWDAATAVRNFLDEEEVAKVYYPEIAEIARAVTGANRAYVFDHLVRKRELGRPPMTFGRRIDGDTPSAAGRVHNDYSLESGQRRLGMVLKNPAMAAAVQRYSIVNLWRSIRHPVLDTPLAVCDARTVAADDLVASDILYPARSGEIYLAHYNPCHQWSYFSAMNRDEILVFKQFDSKTTDAARFTPHAAFDHPHMPADAPLRESIEIRCLLVYDC